MSVFPVADSLRALAEAMDRFIQAVTPRQAPWVVLGNVMANSGKPNPAVVDAVVMSLVNLEPVRHRPVSHPPAGPGGGGVARPAAPLQVTLDVACYANLEAANYIDGLQAISLVLSFFQQHPVLTRENLPSLDSSQPELSLEIMDLEPAELERVMRCLGANYLPTVVVRVRQLVFDASRPELAVAPVTAE